MTVPGNQKRQNLMTQAGKGLSAVTHLVQYNYWRFLTNIIRTVINGTPIFRFLERANETRSLSSWTSHYLLPLPL
jgi:hypothetical protein